jgi:hypothetical protein
MSGYYQKALGRLTDGLDLREYDEDWEATSVSFTLGPALHILVPLDKIMEMCKLLGTNDVTICANGDGRYGGEGGHKNPYYTTISFVFVKVKFPNRPE